MKVRAEKDFWAGVLYVLFALGFLWFGWNYRTGTAARMGPGYFPLTLSWLLGAFGVISIARSFMADGTTIGGIAWKKLFIITTGMVLFGILIGKAGLIFALPALVLISASASEQSEYDLRGLMVMVALTLFCILVFVKGLGVPMPIFGSWFDGLVPPSWQR